MSDANAIPQWFSGSEHTHRVAAAIAQYGPIARTTLAQMLGLSQGALSRITSDLIYAGVIEELPAVAGTTGKLPERFYSQGELGSSRPAADRIGIMLERTHLRRRQSARHIHCVGRRERAWRGGFRPA